MCSFFFFNDTATTEIYTLSLHDALPIYNRQRQPQALILRRQHEKHEQQAQRIDRKSTRLNSSHSQISYAVFCLKKKHRTSSPGVAEEPMRTPSSVGIPTLRYNLRA